MATNLRSSRKDHDVSKILLQSMSEKVTEVLFSNESAKFLKDLISECVETATKSLMDEVKVLNCTNQQLKQDILDLRQQLSEFSIVYKQKGNVNKPKSSTIIAANPKRSLNLTPKTSETASYAGIASSNEAPVKANKTMSTPIQSVSANINPNRSVSPTKISQLQIIANTEDANPDEFKPVTYKKKRKIIRGDGPVSGDLECVLPKIWIYLGRCAPNITEEIVRKFLSDKYVDKQFVITDLNSKGVHKSFKIGADPVLFESLYDANNWPKGALIKQFLFRKSDSARFKQ